MREQQLAWLRHTVRIGSLRLALRIVENALFVVAVLLIVAGARAQAQGTIWNNYFNSTSSPQIGFSSGGAGSVPSIYVGGLQVDGAAVGGTITPNLDTGSTGAVIDLNHACAMNVIQCTGNGSQRQSPGIELRSI